MYLRIRSSAFEINPVLTPISLSRLTVDHDGQGQNESQCQILALPLGRVEFEQDWSLRQGSTSSNVRYPCRLSNLFKSAGPKAGMARSRSARIPGSVRADQHLQAGMRWNGSLWTCLYLGRPTLAYIP